MIRCSPLVLLAFAGLLYVLGFATESMALGTAALVVEAAFWSRIFKRVAADKRP